jgi:hypothetical protein
MVLQNSMVLALTDAVIALPDFLVPDTQIPFQDHRERILFVLERLASMPAIESPKFVFAHLVIPHPPFVFGPNGERVVLSKTYTLAGKGEPLDDTLYIEGFRNQVTFLNHQLKQVLTELLAKSETKPIIILQADHGPGHFSIKNRMAILNAYFLPGKDQQIFYDRISPVNTFRVVLNEYFGGHFPILEDISYFSIYQAPYEFQVITE